MIPALFPFIEWTLRILLCYFQFYLSLFICASLYFYLLVLVCTVFVGLNIVCKICNPLWSFISPLPIACQCAWRPDQRVLSLLALGCFCRGEGRRERMVARTWLTTMKRKKPWCPLLKRKKAWKTSKQSFVHLPRTVGKMAYVHIFSNKEETILSFSLDTTLCPAVFIVDGLMSDQIVALYCLWESYRAPLLASPSCTCVWDTVFFIYCRVTIEVVVVTCDEHIWAAWKVWLLQGVRYSCLFRYLDPKYM